MENKSIIRSHAMATEKIPKLLLQMSLPATIGMLVNALYNVISTVYLGHGIGPDAIGALTIIFPIQMILMGVAQMIGFGGASLISIKLGESKREEADKIAGNAFSVTFALSLLLVVIGLFFTDPLLRLFGASDSLLPYAHDYLKITLIGSCFFTFIMSANAMVRAEGNAMTAMTCMVLGLVIDTAIAPVFIFVLKWGVAGAAIATVISQFASFLFMARYLFFGKSALRLKAHHFKPDLAIAADITRIGFPMFIRNAGSSLLGGVLNNMLLFYGSNSSLVAYGIVSRATMIILMPLFGVSQGLQPIAGFNYGARNFERVRESISLAIYASVAIATFGWVFFVFAPDMVASIFTSEPDIVRQTSSSLLIFSLAFPLIAVQIVIGSAFQALNKARESLVMSLLRQYIILIPLILVLPRMGLGEFGIWVSFPISDALSAIVTVLIYRKVMYDVKMDLCGDSRCAPDEVYAVAERQS
jgi:putative MATE family efflux protein